MDVTKKFQSLFFEEEENKNNGKVTAIKELLQGTSKLKPEKELALARHLCQTDPKLAVHLVDMFVTKAQKLQAKLNEMDSELQSLNTAPLYPAHVLSVFNNSKEDHAQPLALVAAEGQRAIVAIKDGIDFNSLTKGTTVMLDQKLRVIVDIWNELPLDGEIGTFDRIESNRFVIKTNNDSDLLLHARDILETDKLEPGDQVLYDRSCRLVLQRIEKPEETDFYLEGVPDISFNNIGGHSQIINEIKTQLTLHFQYPDVVQQHQLRPTKGILLVGKPGTGKTMLAKAIANWCAGQKGGESKRSVKFMTIPAGSQRSTWYGGTEANYRRIFNVPREEAKKNPDTLIVMFFDELDNIGSRSNGLGNEVDTRTMTALLDQIDGIQSCDNFLLIGATNREDLLDKALIRPGRFGDYIFRLNRPNRDAALEINSIYLKEDLPYYTNGNKKSNHEIAKDIAQSVTSYLYAPNSPRAEVATITFRNGDKKIICPAEVLSGAMLENVIRKAKHQSCVRAIGNHNPYGIIVEDIFSALDEELDNIALSLKSTSDLREWIDIDNPADVAKVEIPKRISEKTYKYIKN